MDSAALRQVLQNAIKQHLNGQTVEALEGYSLFTRHDLTQTDPLNNMAVILRAQGHFEAALACYRRALTINAKAQGIWSNMGNCLRELGRFDEAIAAQQRALDLDGPTPALLHNYGIVYRDLGDMDSAIARFDQGVALDSAHVNCNWDRALAQLMRGDYADGLQGYEWRWKTDRATSRRLTDKLWDGRDLNGGILFLTAEQGFGDTIQFARFIPEAARRGARVIVEAYPELKRLLHGVEGIAGLVDVGGMPEHYDAQLPLLSLPGLFRSTLETLPRQVPYFRIPAAVAADPRLRLPEIAGTRRRIGLIWAGKLRPKDRSCPLTRFMPLLSRKDTAFYSLQMGDRRDDIKALGAQGLIHDMGAHIRDFQDMAVMMNQLDLVISIDSAPAHLAGALGRPTWILLLQAPDWRWMLGRADCPWYPTARLFRQEQINDWSAPTAAIDAAFDGFLQGARR